MTLADLAPLLEVMTEGPSLIIIDDVQAICSDAPGSPAEGSAVTVLKLLAQKYKTHVVAVTDLVQSTEWMEDRYPSLDHLGSSDVEEADNVWLLYRPGMFGLTAPDGTNLDRAVQLTFEKSTEAEGWSIHLDFDPETGLCMEMAGLWV